MTLGDTPAGGEVWDVTVAAHAIERARTRRHFDGLTRVEVAGRIAHEVQQALTAGRVSDRIPAWAARFRMRELRGAKVREASCQPGSRFAWDADRRHGWIIRRDGDTVVVVTSLHRVRGEERAA